MEGPREVGSCESPSLTHLCSFSLQVNRIKMHFVLLLRKKVPKTPVAENLLTHWQSADTQNYYDKCSNRKIHHVCDYKLFVLFS